MTTRIVETERLTEGRWRALLHERLERQAKAAHLTRRQTEVLWLIAAGKSNKEIAAELFIEDQTVKNHITAINKRVGAPTRAAMVLKLLGLAMDVEWTGEA